MKKVISAVLAGAMLATSVGVATPAVAEEAAAPTTSVQKSSVNAVYNQYLDVLQRYKTAQDNNFYRGQYDGPTLENMGLNSVLAVGFLVPKLHYTLVDLANDGTPELFIADLDASSSLPYWMIDLYGYENGSAKRIVNDRSLGYRSAYIITENGYLENQASAGARDAIYQYLTVKPNSATPVYSQSLEYVSWTGDEYYMNYGVFDGANKYSISKTEYDNIRAQYPWKQNITWHPIDDYASLWSELNANTIPVFVDGVQIDFDQQPIIQDDRTLVPLRGVFEALGATVYWNNDTRSVTAYKDDTTIELAIGSSTMYVNGQPKYLDVAGQIINDRTMVPLRAISEAFGSIVYWDNDTRTVRVYSDKSTIPSDPDEPDVEDPEINDPTEPENPDEEEPVDPEIPGTDEPTEPVDPEPPAEEPANPGVVPENPSEEPDNPNYPTTEPEDPVDNAWKQAYIEYINSNQYQYNCEYYYKLVDINGDDIPELYTSSSVAAYGGSICTYIDGKVVEQRLTVMSLSYIEGQNLFLNSGGKMDHYYDYIYRTNGSRFEKVHSGEYYREGFNIDLIYNWDGRQVSETEYNAQLNQVINPNLAISPWDNTTYDPTTHRYVGNGLCNKQEIIQKIQVY